VVLTDQPQLDGRMNAIAVAALAIGTLIAGVALLAFLDWLTGRWHRPAPAPAPVRKVPAAVPVPPGADREPYDTSGVYILGTEGDDAA
jgi:hypothetical protein